MFLDYIPRKAALLLSATMICSGLALGVWAFSRLSFAPSTLDAKPPLASDVSSGVSFAAQAAAHSAEWQNDAAGSPAAPEESALPGATHAATAGTPDTAAQSLPASIHVGFAADTPGNLPQAFVAAAPPNATVVTTTLDTAAGPPYAPPLMLRVDSNAQYSLWSYRQYFAAAARFDTIDPTLSWDELRATWRGTGSTFAAVAVLTDTLPALERLLGDAGPSVSGHAAVADIAAATRQDTPTLAVLPFDKLEPRLVVLAIDGQNPIENDQNFDADAYPLVVEFHAHAVESDTLQTSPSAALLDRVPSSNRQAERLTVLAMTGVTAMVRGTAAQMDKFGSDWPARIIAPELASADITHVSNEVPFVPGCETDTSADNLIFCSKPDYMDALTALGVDIIGLTGNHQNDYSRAAALASLDIYAAAGLPVYGGGPNKEAAFAPLYLEHNGNRLAFLGANSYGPQFAWATDHGPGSAEFDLAIMSAMIRNIKAQDKADLVLVELQYQETYDTQPLIEQRLDFNALVRAGADIVTGVQSHVPQAVEFSDGRLILYGLGNLFFDQMWTQPTREGLIVKHTLYDGRHISTQLLTTLLHDAGQPHSTTPAARATILERVFAASYFE